MMAASKEETSQKSPSEFAAELIQRIALAPQGIGGLMMDLALNRLPFDQIAEFTKQAFPLKVDGNGVDASGTNLIVSKAIVDWSKQNPILHQVLSTTVPAYSGMYKVASIKMAAQRLPSGRGETLTSNEVLGLVGGAFGSQLFHASNPAFPPLPADVPKEAAGFSQHVADQLIALKRDVDSYMKFSKEVSESAKVLYAHLEKFLTYLEKDLKPTVELMRDLVLTPYLNAVKDSQGTMRELIEHYKHEGQSADSAVPKIQGPNLDARQMQRIATGLSLPITGSIAAGEINVLLMQKYQAQHQRGFADDLSMLQAAMAAPGPSLFTPLQQMLSAARPPAWFMAK